MLTERLEIRPAVEADRARFVGFFADDHFMAFSGGVLDADQGNARFDHMRDLAHQIPFAKQSVVERSTGQVIGYSGVNTFELDGEPGLEFGYRLCPESRGKGYATEAGLALLDLARQTYTGTIYAMIDPTNEPSMRVIDKLGFTFWKQMVIYGYLDNLYRIQIPQ